MFGANWKTAISGIGAALFSVLTILAALPYESGGIADIFPVTWKSKILVASAIAAFALKVWNSIAQKDKNVTGGSVQQTTDGGVVPPGRPQSLVAATKAASPLERPHEPGRI